MDKYLLSIIIPIYNLEKYINKCLESIVSQIEENVEIILIDDGSIDNSRKICEEYCEKYKYIKYFYQENSGVSVARNNGLEKATGKYILFIDGDDWILENTLKNIINKLNKNKKIDILAGGFVKQFSEKNIEISSKKMLELINLEYPNNVIKLFKNNLFNPSLCCNIFKKDLFIKNNIYLDKNIKYTEDMDCTIKLFLKSNKIDVLEKPFYVYRQDRKGSATNTVSVKRVEDTMNFVLNWKTFVEQHNLDKELASNLILFVKYQYSIVVGMLFLLDKKERKKIYYRVKEQSHLLIGSKGKKGKLVQITYKIFGFKIVGKLMAFWIKNKSKIGR